MADLVSIWNRNDFDSLYIIKIKTDEDGKRSVKFSVDQQGLNGQPIACPGA
jgi:hypothetical protein